MPSGALTCLCVMRFTGRREVKQNKTCVRPFSMRTCWCAPCKTQYRTGARSEQRCVCAVEFDSKLHRARLCRPCRNAFQSHGSGCCEWRWESAYDAGAQGSTAHAPALWSAARAQREEELGRRLRWCLDHDKLPANRHVHLAPATPEQDALFGQHGPPWDKQGTLIPAGVAWGNPADISIDEQFKIIDYDAIESGYSCTKCAVWIDDKARDFVGNEEPEWWRWCTECRANIKRETSSQKRMRHAAADTRDIRAYHGVLREQLEHA